jgi:CubicO group peptidase (beta-lactamase class C family)
MRYNLYRNVLKTLLLFLALSQASFGQQDQAMKKFEETFKRELTDAGVAGGSFVFLKDNKVAARGFYGTANLEKKQPVDENTIFHWASNTKPFTGIAIMQLRDRGLLKLDDPVTKYLPELRAVHNPFGSMDEITIRHLMTHSAGFRAGTWPWSEGKSWEPFEPTEYSQLVAMFPYTEIRFKPGSRYSYSNPGIIFLGRIIEKLSGEDFEVYIDKNIFKPLEMYQSYFDTTPIHLLKHRSHSYRLEKGKMVEGRFDASTGITVSNGGLNSPFPDMIKYLNFLVGDPSRSAAYDVVLKRSSLEEMWQPAMKAGIGAEGNPANGSTEIGLIFFIDKATGRTLIGHSGHQNGFASYIDVDVKGRGAAIFAINTDVSEGTPAQKDLEARLLREMRKAL